MAEDDKKKEKEKKEESVAGGILKNIGKMIPGLGGLIEGLEKSPAFKERLKEVDKELERKIKEGPSKEVGPDRSYIRSSIPPGVRGRSAWKKSFVGKRPQPAKPEAPPPKPEARVPDVFDEEDHIKVIAEIVGVEGKDINLNLQGDKLTISVDIPDRKYHQELKLPCEPKGKLEKTYKNGILEARIQKAES